MPRVNAPAYLLEFHVRRRQVAGRCRERKLRWAVLSNLLERLPLVARNTILRLGPCRKHLVLTAKFLGHPRRSPAIGIQLGPRVLYIRRYERSHLHPPPVRICALNPSLPPLCPRCAPPPPLSLPTFNAAPTLVICSGVSFLCSNGSPMVSETVCRNRSSGPGSARSAPIAPRIDTSSLSRRLQYAVVSLCTLLR